MIYYLGFFIIVAYILQIILSLIQMKNFNFIYGNLKKKGKVAIGKQAGKIKSGTIVMMAVNEEEFIIDAYKMQGVTIFAKFKPLTSVINININDLDEIHPSLMIQNKLTRKTILQAKTVYLHVKNGTYEEKNPDSVFVNIKNSILISNMYIKNKLNNFRRKSE